MRTGLRVTAYLLVLFCITARAGEKTTADGVALENARNTAERPYRAAGSSDPRDANPWRAHGFGRRERRLLYVALPGGTSGGQFLPQHTGTGIVVLDMDPVGEES